MWLRCGLRCGLQCGLQCGLDVGLDWIYVFTKPQFAVFYSYVSPVQYRGSADPFVRRLSEQRRIAGVCAGIYAMQRLEAVA